MIIAVPILIVLSIAGLIAAVFIGTPAPGYPRHGTFGVYGLDGGFIAWASVGLCVIGLLLLFVDARLERRRPDTQPAEHEHTAADELFGDHEVERDLERET